ncbi:FKBP-type peptidyl-prolyl cis-trans isomerase N-terminal domain-containing protein [Pseudoxanthomonas sp. JBR18]|uniref:FKBP-type peptidyl-prolyl cis-trans isomerase N-terminal domain-containing protein n=1 Tax=Pseudoxanthomonas sp. JBR18 TaxID=2969308 RepID=UPI0023058D27|nr:FKBP-type peptidyl-prolyl cis-trans isomerase N-terminal domain-containing protein [Pseudoxanthomonas sp. JBR18]WCE04227.1 FKBP-type peptidyl-prolyl cis-trans isomerase N-terminal domain-containing protein [Pseudoxanthomonas sp. JBR18]
MKLRLLSASVLAMTLAAGTAAAQTSNSAAASTPAPDRNALSYALGYDLGRNLIESGESVDLATVQKALQEGYAKKEPSVPVDQLRTAVQQMEQRQQAKAKAAFDQAAAANKSKSDAFLAQNKAKAGVQSLPGGVQYRVEESGSGAKPTQASTVTIQYKGSLADGRTFVDTFSPQQGQTTPPPPASLKVSEIPLAGLRDALVQMPAGSRWEVTLPPEKAYGNTPQSPIGPNQAVVFDVKLISVK